MRRPSARVLINRVDWYQATTAESGSGYQPAYPTTPTKSSIPCSVQATALQESGSELNRVTVQNVYDVIFDRDWGIDVRDKLIWIDSTGAQHFLYVETNKDNAGRGAAITVQCLERY